MIGSVPVLLRNSYFEIVCRPVCTENPAQALVLEDFYLVAYGFGHLPGLCAIQWSAQDVAFVLWLMFFNLACGLSFHSAVLALFKVLTLPF